MPLPLHQRYLNTVEVVLETDFSLRRIDLLLFSDKLDYQNSLMSYYVSNIVCRARILSENWK